MQPSVMAASAGYIRNAVALRDACYVRVSSRVPDVLGLPGLFEECDATCSRDLGHEGRYTEPSPA